MAAPQDVTGRQWWVWVYTSRVCGVRGWAQNRGHEFRPASQCCICPLMLSANVWFLPVCLSACLPSHLPPPLDLDKRDLQM